MPLSGAEVGTGNVPPDFPSPGELEDMPCR